MRFLLFRIWVRHTYEDIRDSIGLILTIVVGDVACFWMDVKERMSNRKH